ncbi:MAG: J domain-containing protein [Acidimicrobiia bacterium]|nr:J domain-containing protein [Acidimicrobiia bacterium]
MLGVAGDVDDAALRAAYRSKLRATHPDVARPTGDVRRADAATAEVVAAYRLLRREAATAPPTVDAAPPATIADDAVRVDGDTVAAELPAGDLFTLLADAANIMGEVTYVDPDAGLLETIVELEGFPTASVVFTLHTATGSGGAAPEQEGRATGVTEAWCTVEALSGRPAPPHAAVAELFAAALRRTIATLPP